jgi:hypothetical protein
MYKIAKSEVSYWEPVLYWFTGIYLLIMLIASFRSFLPSEKFYGLLGSLMPLFLVGFFLLNVLYTFFEMRESRLMKIAVLPVPLWKISLARLLGPFLLNLIAILIFVIPAFLDSYRYFGIQQLIRDFFRSHYALIGFGLYWLVVMYGIRLFTELYGRILLGIALLINLIVYVILPIFYWRLAHSLAEIISRLIYMIPQSFQIISALILLCWIALYFSCVNRKSFIAL